MLAILVLAVVLAAAEGCPGTYAEVGSMCVHANRIQSTYAEAYTLCKVVGSQLVEPTSESDKLALSTYLQTLNMDDSFYVKGSDGNGYCNVLVKGQGYQQQTTRCENANFFVCQKS
ncbi:uncharacterized protein [Haliotis asinina]|uniref:uncharacterized protein n=1 Tax=Haliotis asinina TaxID=109174 RepID=UPI00353267DA